MKSLDFWGVRAFSMKFSSCLICMDCQYLITCSITGLKAGRCQIFYIITLRKQLFWFVWLISLIVFDWKSIGWKEGSLINGFGWACFLLAQLASFASSEGCYAVFVLLCLMVLLWRGVCGSPSSASSFRRYDDFTRRCDFFRGLMLEVLLSAVALVRLGVSLWLCNYFSLLTISSTMLSSSRIALAEFFLWWALFFVLCRDESTLLTLTFTFFGVRGVVDFVSSPDYGKDWLLASALRFPLMSVPWMLRMSSNSSMFFPSADRRTSFTTSSLPLSSLSI